MATDYSPISLIFIPFDCTTAYIFFSVRQAPNVWAKISFMAAPNQNIWILPPTSCHKVKVKVNTNKIEYWQQVKLEKSNQVSARCITYVSYCVVEYNKSLCSEYYLLNAQWRCFQLVKSGNTSGEITIWKNVQQLNYLLFMTSTFQYKIHSLY